MDTASGGVGPDLFQSFNEKIFPNDNEYILWSVKIGQKKKKLFPSGYIPFAFIGLFVFVVLGISFIASGNFEVVGIILIFLYFLVIVGVPVKNYYSNLNLTYNAYAITKERVVKYNTKTNQLLSECKFTPGIKVIVVDKYNKSYGSSTSVDNNVFRSGTIRVFGTLKFLNSENRVLYELIGVPDPDGVFALLKELISETLPS